MRLLPPFCLLLAACQPSQLPEVEGPYTGITTRWVADAFRLPTSRSDDAIDLNGDGKPDNQFGNIVGALIQFNDVPLNTLDSLLASGALAPVIEITSDDPELRNDPHVGVRFFGRDGESAQQMGARLEDGVLTSNPVATTVAPVAGTLHLPLFVRADPVVVPARALQITLQSDNAGFQVVVHGAMPADQVKMPAWQRFVTMIEANPTEFAGHYDLFDSDRDGTVSFDEFVKQSIFANVMAPDVQLTQQGVFHPSPDNLVKDSISFAFQMHVKRCDVGLCNNVPPRDPCSDRVLDGRETDIDCGPGCGACASSKHCANAEDCLSGSCVSGSCAASTCSDGVRDGIETDVDCGHNCGGCKLGLRCRFPQDCQSGMCGPPYMDGYGVCASRSK